MRRALLAGGLVLALALLAPAAAAPHKDILASNDRATLAFPERLTFSVDLQSQAEIDDIVLEYGVQQLTCGQVVAKAFPTFTPGQSVSASWTWEMVQSGGEPPGARIWWRWRVHDAAGNESLTDLQTVTWLDDQHPWRTVSGNSLDLHWYEGGQQFANELHDSAAQSIATMGRDSGLVPDGPIDLYIYATQQDLRDAILYEPQWIGGQAHPAYNSVIMAVGPDDLEWGKRVTAHELTHVLVGRYTFSCLGDVPTWLDEGLAVYGEGGWTEQEHQLFDAAVIDDTLLSVRAMAGSFPEDPARASAAYGQSYSLVRYLLTQYGQEEMLALLQSLRDGVTIDEALPQVYGLTLESFEEEWRASIGAAPHGQAGQAPTATPLPTPVPTIEPVSGAPLAPSPGPTRARTAPATTATAVIPAPTSPPTATPQGLFAGLQGLPGWLLIAASIVIGLAIGGLLVFLLNRLFRGRAEP